MYQFQEGFPSPMIELRFPPSGQKPQTLTVSLQSAPVASGAGEVEVQAQLTHQPKPSRKHSWSLAPGLRSAKQARLLTNCVRLRYRHLWASRKGEAEQSPPNSLSVSVRLSFLEGAATRNALLPKMEAGNTVQGEACRIPMTR